jgi:cytochrome c-type biogenesis protein
MQLLWVQLMRALDASPFIALGAAFLWGLLSIILSPCHLASIPLVVGFISEQGQISNRRAFGISALFSGGILVSIAIIGAITASLGRIIGDVGRYGNYVVAAILFVVGLYLMGIIEFDWGGFGQTRIRKRGLLTAFVLGLIFGIALGPCTFAFMAPVLAITFKVAASQSLYALALLFAYGIGHCLVIVLAGVSTQQVQQYLKWNEQAKEAAILRKICGVLVLLGAVYLIYTAC